ncbi:MAG: YbaN family protein [Alistipes sp.]|nr:YbaN family protein [Alistipes sp.]
MRMLLYRIAGYTTMGLAFAGAFVPFFPSSSLILIAVYFFTQCQSPVNRWLQRNRLFGKYVRAYEAGEGIPLSVKIATMISLWSSMLFTAIVFVSHWWLRILLFVLPLLISIYMLRTKTLHKHDPEDSHSAPVASGIRAFQPGVAP